MLASSPLRGKHLGKRRDGGELTQLDRSYRWWSWRFWFTLVRRSYCAEELLSSLYFETFRAQNVLSSPDRAFVGTTVYGKHSNSYKSVFQCSESGSIDAISTEELAIRIKCVLSVDVILRMSCKWSHESVSSQCTLALVYQPPISTAKILLRDFP